MLLSILQGNCTFRENPAIFNCTYPSLGNPYVLDLSEPYKAAVLEELLVSVGAWMHTVDATGDLDRVTSLYARTSLLVHSYGLRVISMGLD